MTKIKIRYIGLHQPRIEFEVKEEIAEQLVKQGECEYVKDGKTKSDGNRDTGSTRVPKKTGKEKKFKIE